MASWTVVLVLASAVTLPVLIGIGLKQLHASSIKTVGIPLLLSTLFMAIAILAVEKTHGKVHLILSLILALIWVGTGFILRFFQPDSMRPLPHEIRSTFRTMGVIFIAFGLLWSGISIFPYLF